MINDPRGWVSVGKWNRSPNFIILSGKHKKLTVTVRNCLSKIMTDYQICSVMLDKKHVPCLW